MFASQPHSADTESLSLVDRIRYRLPW